jgi:hypothetical protein
MASPLMEWPRVRLEVRQAYYQGVMQAEHEWPLARTQYTPLYLDAASVKLVSELPATEATCSYHSEMTSEPVDRAAFDYTFTTSTDLIGYMKLRLWAAASDTDDMDIFGAI